MLDLRVYLPADLETQLRARLAAVGIEAVEDGEESASLLTPLGGLSPTDLRLARRQAGWTQAELARRLGVSKATISQWESGSKSIPPRRLPRLRALIGKCLSGVQRGGRQHQSGQGRGIIGSLPGADSRHGLRRLAASAL